VAGLDHVGNSAVLLNNVVSFDFKLRVRVGSNWLEEYENWTTFRELNCKMSAKPQSEPDGYWRFGERPFPHIKL
jgi:hypothetical protein